MISEKEFFKSIKKFEEVEKRGSFYDMAVNLYDNGYEIEAYTLILATWNFARFRFFVKDFDIDEFREKIYKLNPLFKNFLNLEFRNINFDDYEEDISKIYKTLSLISGIEFTGASKIMHLKNRRVFVMWDTYIKGKSKRKYYENLQIIKTKKINFKKYGDTSSDYIRFLKDMQLIYGHIQFDEGGNKTFAKAIDEFNYINITLPIQKIENEEKSQKK